jgi:hypothetical protein
MPRCRPSIAQCRAHPSLVGGTDGDVPHPCHGGLDLNQLNIEWEVAFPRCGVVCCDQVAEWRHEGQYLRRGDASGICSGGRFSIPGEACESHFALHSRYITGGQLGTNQDQWEPTRTAVFCVFPRRSEKGGFRGALPGRSVGVRELNREQLSDCCQGDCENPRSFPVQLSGDTSPICPKARP